MQTAPTSSRYDGVARPEDERLHGAARDAVHTLLQAVRALRQHADQPRLCETALRRCATAVREATASAPLVVPLVAGSAAGVSARGLVCVPGEVPFGALLAAGFGELVVTAEAPADDLERFLRMLATVDAGPDAAIRLARRLVTAAVTGVQLRAAPFAAPATTATADFALLPPPREEPAMRPHVARERTANLPTLAARLVLADLASVPGRYRDRLGRHLEPLLLAMLGRGDATGASWLLQQVATCGAIGTHHAEELRRTADSHCGPGWFTTQLGAASHSDVFALVALAMQLGNRALVDLSAAARESGHSHAPWIQDILRN